MHSGMGQMSFEGLEPLCGGRQTKCHGLIHFEYQRGDGWLRMLVTDEEKNGRANGIRSGVLSWIGWSRCASQEEEVRQGCFRWQRIQNRVASWHRYQAGQCPLWPVMGKLSNSMMDGGKKGGVKEMRWLVLRILWRKAQWRIHSIYSIKSIGTFSIIIIKKTGPKCWRMGAFILD